MLIHTPGVVHREGKDPGPFRGRGGVALNGAHALSNQGHPLELEEKELCMGERQVHVCRGSAWRVLDLLASIIYAPLSLRDNVSLCQEVSQICAKITLLYYYYYY